MLRIALPKGRMSEESLELFNRAGITNLRAFPDDRKLIHEDAQSGLQFLLIRSKDVGTYVEQGAADIGIIGYDVLQEHEFDVRIPLDLKMGKCRLSTAYPAGRPEFRNKRNLKVATKYPRLAHRHFFSRGYNIEIIELYGSIEIAPLTGLSDIIVDLVSTGSTLKANQLIEDEIIMESSARLILNTSSSVLNSAEIGILIEKLSGTIS